MRVHSLVIPDSNPRFYEVPEDGLLLGVVSQFGFIVSSDPSMTYAIWAGGGDFQTDSLLISADSPTVAQADSSKSLFPLNIPVSKGERIYCATNGGGWIQLFFEP